MEAALIAGASFSSRSDAGSRPTPATRGIDPQRELSRLSTTMLCGVLNWSWPEPNVPTV